MQPPPAARPRRPSKLGLALTFALLGGLLVWRWAVPLASPWLDAALLAVAGAVLVVLRARLRR